MKENYFNCDEVVLLYIGIKMKIGSPKIKMWWMCTHLWKEKEKKIYIWCL